MAQSMESKQLAAAIADGLRHAIEESLNRGHRSSVRQMVMATAQSCKEALGSANFDRVVFFKQIDSILVDLGVAGIDFWRD